MKPIIVEPAQLGTFGAFTVSAVALVVAVIGVRTVSSAVRPYLKKHTLVQGILLSARDDLNRKPQTLFVFGLMLLAAAIAMTYYTVIPAWTHRAP